jgi:hypothetical protein
MTDEERDRRLRELAATDPGFAAYLRATQLMEVDAMGQVNWLGILAHAQEALRLFVASGNQMGLYMAVRLIRQVIRAIRVDQYVKLRLSMLDSFRGHVEDIGRMIDEYRRQRQASEELERVQHRKQEETDDLKRELAALEAERSQVEEEVAHLKSKKRRLE